MSIHVTPSGKVVMPFHGAMAAVFPEHERKLVAGTDYMALPYDVSTAIMARRFGLDMPAPVLSQYDWGNAPRTPFEVQRQTVSFLTLNTHAYVLNGMGTGKTLSALWAFDFLRVTGFARRALIVAPVSTLYATWASEIFNNLPHLKYVVLDGTKGRRLKRLNEDWDVAIVNHDGVKVVLEALNARDDIDVLVLDELAVYRNGRAARTKEMIKFAANKSWVWGMTGSPASMGPISVWAQCQIVTPHTVPKYFGHFQKAVQTKLSQFRWEDKPDALERALDVMQPSVRFSLDDVIELPAQVMQHLDVPMSAKQKTVYKAMTEAAAAMVDSGDVTAANAGALLNKLLQISAGWVYNSQGQIVELDGGARLDACIDAITSASGKVIVFANFKHVVAGISERLTAEGIEFATITGETPSATRTQIFHDFQNTSKYKVLDAAPGAMAHGVTLTEADTVIWYGPTLSLETYNQANARIRRIGQRRKQLILHLCSSPAERRMYKNLENRDMTQTKLLDLFRDRTALAV
ncbi:DEAD/DEAH box helicase [Methylocystis heyeri]|uniref:ATP-dependent helicase n=1 Tax=Methylocystis heyeri TaxID=391905 RepID=A0A6B8KI17_9HYPH|nr:DEAD/DEAH box helicase [Methylocystis heyeri]QGM46140.1 ATP-dependent helicase [Methylocystis heyeri]